MLTAAAAVERQGMKLRTLAAVALVLLGVASSADAERSLSIFSDAALTNSSLDDNVPGIVSLYVVDTGFQGATGVRFSTEPTAGFTGVWMSDASPYVSIGNSQTRIDIGYGTCYPAPVLALTMTYQMFGTSSACSELRIVPPDGWTWVVAPDVDCSFMEGIITDLRSLRVNCALATEPTTWGRVKALYRN